MGRGWPGDKAGEGVSLMCESHFLASDRMSGRRDGQTLTMTIIFAVAVCLVLIIGPTARAQDEKRPNIIFLMADDQCTYSMGCYGTSGVKTPNFDRLADDGIVFDRHYVTTAICMASRANVMTGMLEYKHGCNFDHGPLLGTFWQNTYPILLRKAGYRTGFAGKFGFVVSNMPSTKGRPPESDFDVWGGGPGQTSYSTAKNTSMKRYAKEYPHSTLSYGAFGRDFVEGSVDTGKPFCLSISFKAPHHPVTPDPKFDDVYDGYTFTKPKNFGRELGLHFSLQSRQGRQYERFHSWGYSNKYDEVMAKYYQQIYAIDVALGMIRHALRQHGFEKNTVIIYTSDNGFMCGSHGYGSKVLPYEESSRVPLIVYDPRHPNSGKKLRCNSLTGNIDFAPTILSLAGVSVPANMDGKNLMPLYDDPKAACHDSLPLINVWGPAKVHSLSVVTDRTKYIYWPYSNSEMSSAEELYDLSKDPLELKNLATDKRQQISLAASRTLYDKHVQHWKDFAVPFHKYSTFGNTFSRLQDAKSANK